MKTLEAIQAAPTLSEEILSILPQGIWLDSDSISQKDRQRLRVIWERRGFCSLKHMLAAYKSEVNASQTAYSKGWHAGREHGIGLGKTIAALQSSIDRSAKTPMSARRGAN